MYLPTSTAKGRHPNLSPAITLLTPTEFLETTYRGCACDVTSHVLSFVSVKKAAYVYCYCISSLWERLVAPSDARIVSRKEAA